MLFCAPRLDSITIKWRVVLRQQPRPFRVKTSDFSDGFGQVWRWQCSRRTAGQITWPISQNVTQKISRQTACGTRGGYSIFIGC